MTPSPPPSTADDAYVPTSFGGRSDYMRRKRLKLQNQDAQFRAAAPPAPQLFEGHVFAALGYTTPNSLVLRQMVVQHGGVWREIREKGVTVVLATALPPKKREAWRAKKSVRVVLPVWVVESVAAGKLLDWRAFWVGGEGEAQGRLSWKVERRVEREIQASDDEGKFDDDDDDDNPADDSGDNEEDSWRDLRPLRLPGEVQQAPPCAQPPRKRKRRRSRSLPRHTGQPPEPFPGEIGEVPPYSQSPLREEEEKEGEEWTDTAWWIPPPSHQPESKYKAPKEEEDEEEEDEEEEKEEIEREDPGVPVDVPSKEGSDPTTPSDSSTELEPTTAFWKSESPDNSQEMEPPPPTGVINGIETYEAEAVIGERKHPANRRPRNMRGKVKLLIKWKGYSEQEATWEWEDTLREDLGDDTLDEMWERYKAEKVARSKSSQKPRATTKSSQKNNIRLPSQQNRSQPSSQQKISFSQVTKPSSQNSNKESIKKSSAVAEQIVVQPPKDAVEDTLPTGFSFMPDSFSTIHLSDEENEGGGLPKSNSTLNKPPRVEEEEDIRTSQLEIRAKLLQHAEDEDAIPPGSQRPQRKKSDEAEWQLPSPPLAKHQEASNCMPIDIPDTLPSIALTSNARRPPMSSSSPSSAETLKALGQKRSALPEPFTRAPKKLKYAEEDTSLDLPVVLEKPDCSWQEITAAKAKAQTPEEFNEAFLKEPKVFALSVLNPEFLPNYFRESRLHYLSVWKAELRSRLQEAAARRASQPVPQQWTRSVRYIMHVDFDCFFAAVSTRDRPDLKDKPVVICHGKTESSTTSEISACNYPARKFGVKNGMWMASAKRLCPDIISLGYDFDKYEEASEAFYDVILNIGGERIQAVSVDEALVDISNLVCNDDDNISNTAREEAAAQKLATKIRDECRKRTRCEVSVGIGMNVVMARLALRKAKPAGQCIIPRSGVETFIEELNIGAFPGIGRHTAGKIAERLGSGLVSKVREATKAQLQQILGAKTGVRVYELCRGIDDTPVGAAEAPRESISVAVNWGIRFYHKDQAEEFLHRLSSAVEERMKKEGVKGRTLNFKVAKRAPDAPFETEKFLGCGRVDEVNRSYLFNIPIQDAKLIFRKCVELLRSFRISPGDIRGFGIGMKGLEDETVDNGQQRLQFLPSQSVESVGKAKSETARPVLQPQTRSEPQLKLAAPAKITAYVKPKPMTLMDAFAKKNQKKAGMHVPTVEDVMRTKQATPPAPAPAPLPPPPPQGAMVRRATVPRYSPPKVPTLLDPFTKKKQPEASQFLKPIAPRGRENVKVYNDVVVQKKQVVPASSLPPSTQFDIPSPSQIDITCLPFLPIEIQEHVLRERETRGVKKGKGKEAEQEELEKPPNSQWDIHDWNSFAKDVRDEIRAEHEAAEIAAQQKRARGAHLLSPRKKQNQATFFQNSPFKPPPPPPSPPPAAPSKPIPPPTSNPSKPGTPKQPQHPILRPTFDVPKNLEATFAFHKLEPAWLFSRTGGGYDPEVFNLHTRDEQLRVIARAAAARDKAVEEESKRRALEAGARRRRLNAVRIMITRVRPVLCFSDGAEVGSADSAAVRAAMKAWVGSVEQGGELKDGDVEMLCSFLVAVVGGEGRVDKAAGLVRYFLGLAGEMHGWGSVCERVVEEVREAARAKGYAELELGF